MEHLALLLHQLADALRVDAVGPRVIPHAVSPGIFKQDAHAVVHAVAVPSPAQNPVRAWIIFGVL